MEGGALKDVLLYVGHDTNKIPLARSRNNTENSSMRLSIEDDGVYFEADLDIESNVDARSVYSAIQRGDITGVSAGFYAENEDWYDIETNTPRRVIKALRVVEISLTPLPCYKDTFVSALRSLDCVREELDSLNAEALELEKLKTLWRLNNG